MCFWENVAKIKRDLLGNPWKYKLHKLQKNAKNKSKI